MKNFLITKEQVDLFLKYLGQKPHDEVQQGINLLKNLPEHKEKGEVKAPPVNIKNSTLKNSPVINGKKKS